jgi:hypothetical protein
MFKTACQFHLQRSRDQDYISLTHEDATDRLSCNVGNLITNQRPQLAFHYIAISGETSHQSDIKMVIDTIVMTLIKQKFTKWQYHKTEKLS